jgi:hypothetical protein
MNRNPAKPKLMQPCTCPSRFVECNCEALKARRQISWWRIVGLAWVAAGVGLLLGHWLVLNGFVAS